MSGIIAPMDVDIVHNHIKKSEWLVLVFFLLAGLVFSWFCLQIGFRLPSLIFGLPALFCFAAVYIAYRRSISWTHLSLHRDLLTIHFRRGRLLEFPIPASIIRVDHTKGMRDFTLTLRNGSRTFYLITQRIVERELFDKWLGLHLKIRESLDA
jgi:hypothetical protein